MPTPEVKGFPVFGVDNLLGLTKAIVDVLSKLGKKGKKTKRNGFVWSE